MKLVKKPWLNSQGKPLSKDELKQVSKTWDMATWEEYLKTLDVPQRETTTAKFDRLLKIYENSTAYTLPEVTDEEEGPQTKRLHWAMSLLTQRQQSVLDLIFWQGYSIQETAEKLGITKSAAQSCEEKALKQLKILLETPEKSFLLPIEEKAGGGPYDFHMYRGPQIFYKLPFRLN